MTQQQPYLLKVQQLKDTTLIVNNETIITFKELKFYSQFLAYFFRNLSSFSTVRFRWYYSSNHYLPFSLMGWIISHVFCVCEYHYYFTRYTSFMVSISERPLPIMFSIGHLIRPASILPNSRSLFLPQYLSANPIWVVLFFLTLVVIAYNTSHCVQLLESQIVDTRYISMICILLSIRYCLHCA